MSLFSFLKEAGEKILDALTPDKAEANSEALTKHVQECVDGDRHFQDSGQGRGRQGHRQRRSGDARKRRKKSCWRWATWQVSAVLKTRSP